jgi:hypothetical protein
MDKYFSFSNEATRSEFWAVHLVCWFGSWFAMIAGLIIAGMFTYVNDLLGGLMGAIIILATIAASLLAILAVTVRRCREINITPWWCLPVLIPMFGFIVTVILGILPPDPGRVRLNVSDKT